eukprot:gene6590-13336_t
MLRRSYVLLLVFLGLEFVTYCHAFLSSQLRANRRTSLNSDNKEDATVWNQQVRYIDLNNIPEPSDSARELPLFLLTYPFFPEGSTNLNIFEMKYRTMMFDVSQKDDRFGYIQVDEKSGQIAQIGTLCKITERELLEDGRQLISLDGVERFQIRRILKTLPYVLAEVEIIQDEPSPNLEEAIKLEKEVYDLLKFYIRLMKTLKPNKGLVVSQGLKRNRPTATTLNDDVRRSKFTLSLGNMIQMGTKESQLLLQTTSMVQRLASLKLVLTNVAEFAAQGLIEDNLMTAATRDEIRLKTYSDDFDADILPPDEIVQSDEVEKDEWDISNIE